jgi:hypothetical protein
MGSSAPAERLSDGLSVRLTAHERAEIEALAGVRHAGLGDVARQLIRSALAAAKSAGELT